MKKPLSLLLSAFILFAFNTSSKAQAPTPMPKIFGSSPFQDSLWGIDSTFWNVIFRTGPTLPGFTITGMNGLAYDPTTYETYIIMKVSGVTGRVLGKIDLATGVCTQVGNLGSNFSSLTFDGSGQLYGATGNGATPPETLFKIDKTTAATTLMYAMGSGADGEVLCYNRADDFIYHWSGNGTMVMEKMARTDVAYTPINIVTTGLSSGETFGALYLSPTNFIISNISSQFKRLSASGDYGAVLASLPDDLRGIVMPPQFTNSTTTICQGETFYIGAGSLQLFDSVTYYWGDGTHSAIAITNMGLDGASHIYSSAGTFDVHILLDNGFVRDTISQLNVTVNPTPVVAISGSAALCPLASNTFTVSGTGILQWYYNGTILAGETTNSYTTNVLGVYNLTETNSFGCSDSAAIGLTLINVPNPTVTANSTAPAICSGAPVTLTGGGASTYVWDNSVTDGVVFNPTASTTYNVIGTDVNGCTNTASIAVTVNVLPTVTANSSAAAICIGDIVTLTGGGAATYIWDNSVLDNVAFAPTDTTMYTVIGTDINGCTNTSSVTVIVNTLPIVTITGATSICNGSNTTLTANGASTYAWTGGPSTAGYTVAPSTNITYTVTATDLNGCINTATVLVTVNTVNVATTTSGVTITATATSSTYFWINCPSGTAAGSTTQSFTPSANGSYAVIVTTGSCSDTSACVNISTIGINEQSQNSSVQVYPNPNNGTFVIQSSQEGTYSILNELGQILQTVVLNSTNNFTMNVESLNAGVYILTGLSNKSVIYKRIVVSK